MVPGADKRLANIFARIGQPAPRPFVPDPFQVRAVGLVEEGDVLVTAPTGSGKTWIAEAAIARVLARGGRSWYACPLKALSNSKLQEFSRRFGPENVGILTGDRKENADAPVIVGTTEILRNQMYDCMRLGEDLNADFVVLDEAHFLGDPDRGVVWEETMIYLPSRVPLLLLSATVGNAGEISDWLSSIRSRPCHVVEEHRRPVPLFPLFLRPDGTLLPLVSKKGTKRGEPLDRKVAEYAKKRRAPAFRGREGLPPFGAVLEVLRVHNLLPAIFFLKSRADCDNSLGLCPYVLDQDPPRQEKVRARLSELLAREPYLAGHKQRARIERSAVAAHHSGQLPAWKLVVESLMREGLLDAVFATSTVAAGVNFPARCIVLTNSDRFNGVEFLPLSSTEYHQMTGRAGRRGMDRVGFALVLPGRYMDLELIALLNSSGPSSVLSQIRVNFSMVLNLLLSHTPEDARVLLERCFARYLALAREEERGRRRAGKSPGDWLWRDFQRHLDFLKAEGFVDASGKLTEDGEWAAMLRVDQPLLIAECLRRGLFPEKDPALLAALVSPFVLDKEHDARLDPDHLPRRLLTAGGKMVRALTPLARRMQAAGFGPRPLPLWAPATLFAWANGAPWETACRVAGMAEGDLAMLVLRTAENLRQIAALADVFPGVAGCAREAAQLLIRPPVTPDDSVPEEFLEGETDAGDAGPEE
jgi:superfamily II RNA helicase